MTRNIFKFIRIFFYLLVSTSAVIGTHSNIALAAPVDKIIGDQPCVVANGSSMGCATTSANSGVFQDLYNAIYSQGAVITLLDEPLSNDNLITVLKVCNYIQNQTDPNQIALGTCYEYYTKSCPKGRGNTFSQTARTQKIEGEDDLATSGYFRCQLKQVIIASSGAGLAQKYLKMIYDFGTTLAGIIAVLIIMINGIKIIVSGSDEAAVSEAKKQITTSLVALAVLFMSGFILYIINPNFFTA